MTRQSISILHLKKIFFLYSFFFFFFTAPSSRTSFFQAHALSLWNRFNLEIAAPLHCLLLREKDELPLSVPDYFHLRNSHIKIDFKTFFHHRTPPKVCHLLPIFFHSILYFFSIITNGCAILRRIFYVTVHKLNEIHF